MRALCLIVAALTACANLPDTASSVCGNGVLEDHEDCDSSDPACVQCKIACTHLDIYPAPIPTCELGGEVVPGYRCGADDRCHAPSGVFGPEVSSFEFPVNQGYGGDLDGDGIGDLIGFSDINIDVHFGDPQGRTTAQSTVIVPFANTNPALRRVRIPGSLAEKVDILLPTADGIAAYTAQDQQIVPFPFASDPREYASCATQNDTRYAFAAYAVTKQQLAILTIPKAPPYNIDVAIMDISTGKCSTVSLCNEPIGMNDTLSFDAYPGTAPGASIFTVTLGSTASSTASTCLLATAAPQGTSPPTIRMLRPTAIDGYLFPATLLRTKHGDTCPSLVTVASDGLSVLQWPGTTDINGCTIGTTSQTMNITDPILPVGRIALVPEDIRYAPDALVMATPGTTNQGGGDVYFVQSLDVSLAYHAQRLLYPVHSGDLDGDGRGDAVGASILGFAAPDLDVLYRTNDPTKPSFLAYRVPTRTAPTLFDVGDFDGNGITDIVYVEHVGGRDDLMISYGTKDRPLAPVAITSFTHVRSLAVVDLKDSLDPAGGLLDDLLVIDDPSSDPASTTTRITLFHGNPQRSMLAYFDPRLTNNNSEILSIVPGNFAPAPGSDGFPRDVVAFERFRPGPVGANLPATLWLIRGDTDGEALISADKHKVSIPGTSCDGPDLCLPTSRFLPWTIAAGGSTRDVVIGIDSPIDPMAARHIVTIDPQPDPAKVTPTPSTVTDMMPGDLILSAASVADVNGDGKNELWLGLGRPPGAPMPMTAPSPGRLLRCDVDPSGVVQHCDDMSPAADTALPHPISGTWQCTMGFPADMRPVSRLAPEPPRTSTDIVALCHLGQKDVGFSAVVKFSGVSDDVIEIQPLTGLIPAAIIALADTNGDHLDDLVTVQLSDMGLATVHVRLQCEATDAACVATRPPTDGVAFQ